MATEFCDKNDSQTSLSDLSEAPYTCNSNNNNNFNFTQQKNILTRKNLIGIGNHKNINFTVKKLQRLHPKMNLYAMNSLLLLLITSPATALTDESPSQQLRGLQVKATICTITKECGNGLCVTTTMNGFSFDNCRRCTNPTAYKATGLDESGNLICENVNECASPSLNNCDLTTQDCVDTDGGYTCLRKDTLGLAVNLPSEDESILNVVGTADDHWVGHSVSSAGDVNGDGIDDVIIGSPIKDAFYRDGVGAAYILFGRADGTLPSPDELDGSQGFAVFGKLINDRLGESVSSAGDINGDGFDDVIIGAPGVEAIFDDGSFYAGAGEAYVIFGSAAPFPSFISAYDIDGTNGFVIQGSSIYSDLGFSVSFAGDVNGDGVSDVIVGAPRADPSGSFNGGEAYVIFGSTIGLPSLLRVNELNGTNGFIIEGETDRDYLGMSVSFAGDLNADGITDVIVGATAATNSDGVDSGAAYIIYGSTVFERSVKTAGLIGSDGFAIYGNDRSRMGFSVAYAGDTNGDSIDDVIIGAPRANINPIFASGDAYIVYGSASGFISPMSTTDPGITTIIGKDVLDGFGFSVKSAGDVNGDNISDLIIGAPYGTDEYSAEAYIVYGSLSDLPSEINAADLNGDLGMTMPLLPQDFDGENSYQISVSSAGDINGDGKEDLIIGLSSIDMADNTKQGRVQIIFGQ